MEITFSGIACTHAEDGGALRRIELRVKPNGSADLGVTLGNHDGSSTVKTILNIRGLEATERILSIDCYEGIRQTLECVALHDAAGRERILAIRHLAELAQT